MNGLLVVLSAMGFVLLLLGFFLLADRSEDSKSKLKKENKQLRLEAARNAQFLDGLHELVLQHRELDPALSTIVLDELRLHRSKRKELE